jgi:hypothetical protein
MKDAANPVLPTNTCTCFLNPLLYMRSGYNAHIYKAFMSKFGLARMLLIRGDAVFSGLILPTIINDVMFFANGV